MIKLRTLVQRERVVELRAYGKRSRGGMAIVGLNQWSMFFALALHWIALAGNAQSTKASAAGASSH